MSSILRKLERNKVKQNIKKDGRSVRRCFEQEWKDYRENKYVIKDEEGNVISDKTPKNTMKKKKRHFDNVEQYTNFFAFLNGLKDKNEEEDEESVEVVE